MKKILCFLSMLVLLTFALSGCGEDLPEWAKKQIDYDYNIDDLLSLSLDSNPLAEKHIILTFNVTDIQKDIETNHITLIHEEKNQDYLSTFPFSAKPYSLTIKAYTTIPYYENTIKTGDTVKVQGIVYYINHAVFNNANNETEYADLLTELSISPCIVLNSSTQ
jgi:hypothetical protein